MIISKTPMRISFLGGGTDYPSYFTKHGGAVLGTAVDINGYHSIHSFYSELFDYNIRLAYRQLECVSKVADIKHNLFRICLQHCNIISGVEINYTSELPALTGLGTSSTFVVGILNALYAYRNEFVSPKYLADEAIHIERNILQDTVGCQDQIFAAFGGINYIEFRKNGDYIVNKLPISNERIREIESHLVLVYTGIRRHSTKIATEIVKNIEQNKDTLFKMRELAEDGASVLSSSKSILNFGEMLHKSWLHKSKLSNSISNSAINELYSRGLAKGAVGGKLLGAGGGGFLLFVVPPEKQSEFISGMNVDRVLTVKINAPGSHIVYAQDSSIK